MDSCIDTEVNIGTYEKPQWKTVVKIPTIGGLALAINCARSTLYDWAAKYPEFSYIMEQLGANQENGLINKGLSGDYNPTISKVILTKHGYREGLDQTTNEKDLPASIIIKQKDDSQSSSANVSSASGN